MKWWRTIKVCFWKPIPLASGRSPHSSAEATICTYPFFCPASDPTSEQRVRALRTIERGGNGNIKERGERANCRDEEKNTWKHLFNSRARRKKGGRGKGYWKGRRRNKPIPSAFSLFRSIIFFLSKRGWTRKIKSVPPERTMWCSKERGVGKENQ